MFTPLTKLNGYKMNEIIFEAPEINPALIYPLLTGDTSSSKTQGVSKMLWSTSFKYSV